MPIRNYLHDRGVFDPETLGVMSAAFEQACAALSLRSDETGARGALAERVIALACEGVLDVGELRDRAVRESTSSA